MITIRHKGNFNKTEKFLKALQKQEFLKHLDQYGREGVKALTDATPINSGETATSWGYELDYKQGRVELWWTNSNVVDGVNVAILIQYGHGTRNGGYVEGIDYINPALKPVFDKIADKVWREVKKL